MSNFNWNIEYDKKLHLIAGFIITAIASLILPFHIAVVFGILAGAAKETYDYYSQKGTPELADFLYTIAGSAAFAPIYCLLNFLFL